MKIFKTIPVFVLFTLLVAGCQSAAPTPPPSPATQPIESLTQAPAPTPTRDWQAQPWRPSLPAEPCVPDGTRTCQVVFVLPAQYYAESGRRFPDQFQDAGYTVTMASNAPEVVEVCEDTVRDAQPEKNIPVDIALAQVRVADYDAVLFIGGLGCQDQWHDEEAHRIAREAIEQGKVVGAAGCASTILAHAGLLQGKTATVCSGDPPVKHGQDYCAVLQSQGAVCSKALIVRDGLIVTAKQTSPYFVAGVIEVISESTPLALAPTTVAPLTQPTPQKTETPATTPVPATSFSLEKSAQKFDVSGTFQAGLGDLDGDGDLDAVLANPLKNYSQVWLNDGGAQKGAPGHFTNTGQRLTQYGHGVGVADFDGDDDLDAFIACHFFVSPSRVYLNDGNATFQDTGQDLGDAKTSGAELNLVDLNGDGAMDVHVMYYDPKGLPDKVYLNDGKANFADSGLRLDEETIAWGDLDGDGDTDYFGKRWGQGYVVMLNDGGAQKGSLGQFTTAWQMDDSQSANGGVALADFDGDGDLDALVANGSRDTGSFPSRLFWNDGGQFTDSGQRLNDTLGAELGVGDLDGDGDLDVFVSNFDLPNEVWLNDGTGHFTDSGLRLGESTDSSTKPSLGDLDGDGDLDIFVGSLTGKPKIWINTTPTSVSVEPASGNLYLGQVPPGLDVQVFAPGIVSIENGKEYKITFSPDLDIFFTRRTPSGQNDRLWHSHLENGKLTMPELAPFGYDCLESDASFTPDGKRLYFNSRRPLPGKNTVSGQMNVWFVDKTGDGWSEPKFLGSPLNDYRPVYFSFANDGTFYFTRSSPREIWYAELQDGQYVEAQRLPDEINDLRDVAHPAIAPDKSYIIVDSYYEQNGQLTGSLYISFRKLDGTWTKAVSMRDVLKASDSDIYASARITPEGKYIFFEKYEKETDRSDIYWVSAKVIEPLIAE